MNCSIHTLVRPARGHSRRVLHDLLPNFHERKKSMLRLKFLFAVLVVAVIAGLATQASAQVNVKTIIIGASGSWQAMGVAGYRAGACPSGGGQCKHWTDKTWTVTDSRPVGLGGSASTDAGTAWVLWGHNRGGCAPPPLLLFFVVGVRCKHACAPVVFFEHCG